MLIVIMLNVTFLTITKVEIDGEISAINKNIAGNQLSQHVKDEMN